jgi:hypothetical protein
MPASARSIIQEYLNMVDWRHILTGGPEGGTEDWYTSPGFTQWRERQTTKVIPEPEVGEMVKSLIYEPPGQSLTEGLEEIKGLLKEGTPISWLRETLEATSVRGNDSRLAPIPCAARQEMQLSRSFDGHLSRMRIIEMWFPKVRSFL